MTRSAGTQIRGGEAAAMIRFSNAPVDSHKNNFDVLIGIDWQNAGKYATEFCLCRDSLIIGDPNQGEVPKEILTSGASEASIKFKQQARKIKGRPNMLAVGVVAKHMARSCWDLMPHDQAGLAHQFVEQVEGQDLR